MSQKKLDRNMCLRLRLCLELEPIWKFSQVREAERKAPTAHLSKESFKVLLQSDRETAVNTSVHTPSRATLDSFRAQQKLVKVNVIREHPQWLQQE